MDIKEMLRALLRAGYTEEAIAKGAKVPQSTISRILSGKVRDPKSSVAVKICNLSNPKISQRPSIIFIAYC